MTITVLSVVGAQPVACLPTNLACFSTENNFSLFNLPPSSSLYRSTYEILVKVIASNPEQGTPSRE